VEERIAARAPATQKGAEHVHTHPSRATSRRTFLIAAGGVTLAAATAPAGDPTRLRKDAARLTAAERRVFVEAVLALKRRPSPYLDGVSIYDQFVLWHRDAFDCLIMAAHNHPAFLPWHRQFLIMFEDELRRVDPDVTIPYWDWTVDRTPDSSPWQPDLMGGNGDPAQEYAVTTGPFRKGAWELVVFDHEDDDRLPYLTRDFGRFPGRPDLPTAADAAAALAVTGYDVPPWDERSDPARSFRNNLEGWRDCEEAPCPTGPVCHGEHALHNGVHLWVSGEFELAHEGGHETTRHTALGTMAANSSPNDPVFFLHHANVDRIWAIWQRRHGVTNYAPVAGGPRGHNLDDRMWPYYTIGRTVTPRDMLDHRALGYRYDDEAP
jgi:tyrosinase